MDMEQLSKSWDSANNVGIGIFAISWFIVGKVYFVFVFKETMTKFGNLMSFIFLASK